MEDLSDYRKSYEKSALIEGQLPDDAMQLFQRWFYEADAEEQGEVNAMTVATIGSDGFPKARIVLLKRFTYEGFVFYTNYDSEKGKAIANNPKICLSFFWPNMERQVIIKGIAEKVAASVSDAYFDSRPDGSKLGAAVSNQSEVISSRKVLEDKLAELESAFKNNPIPRPENWGGYLVKPLVVEFWQGRPNRLHDRIRYTIQEDFSSKIERLAP